MTSHSELLAAALSYGSVGLSVAPAGADKMPTIRWKPFQARIATQSELRRLLRGSNVKGLGFVAGRVSGNLEVLDFDCNGELFKPWCDLIGQDNPALFKKLVLEDSPAGKHVYYRSPDVDIPGNRKLARKGVEVPEPGQHEYKGKSFEAKQYGDKWFIIVTPIETRGEGGFCVCAPSPGYTATQGDLRHIPSITPAERALLVETALSLNTWVEPQAIHRGPTTGRNGQPGAGLLPGQDFDERGDIAALLQTQGWTKTGRAWKINDADAEYWRRPGKARGHSASLIDGRTLFVFSSNAHPFESDRAYSPFAVYAIFEHDGDFSQAAKALAGQGYGTKPEASQNPKAKAPQGFTAADLLATDFPEPRWAVPGILPVGLSLLAGKPKMGKSWFCINLGVSIASGDRALGTIKVPKGDVLYLALEDSPRRLKSRLLSVLAGETAPRGLHFFTAWAKVDAGGIEHLDKWLTEHSETRLILVDTLVKVRPQKKAKDSPYSDDYAAVEGLKGLADKHGVAIVLVHHLRKLAAEDALDTVSGTTGLTGGVDTVLVLARTRGRADAVLHVTGRDVEEQELALMFDKRLTAWQIVGDADDYRRSHERQEVVDLLRQADEPMGAKDIAEALGRKQGNIRKLLFDMTKAGDIRKVGRGRYIKISNIGNVSNVDNSGNIGNVSGTNGSNVTNSGFDGNNTNLSGNEELGSNVNKLPMLPCSLDATEEQEEHII